MGSGDGVVLGAPPLLPGNYLPEACEGCVIVHKVHPLIVGVDPLARGGDCAPFQWDVASKVFAVVNASRHTCFTYLTFCNSLVVSDCNGQPFTRGSTRDEDGHTRPATTFVVVAEPETAIRLGFLEASPGGGNFYAIGLERLLPHPFLAPPVASSSSGEGGTEGDAPGLSSVAFVFPLPAADGPYLCTQGVGGHLTHFFPESYHAIDLRCRCHTPVLCIGDGVVREVAQSHSCGGVHAANLASWNSVSVLLSCGLVVDYLHILPGSATVRAGDAVHAGEVLCASGDIGFAPEPHLHIELHDAKDPDGPSMPLRFAPASGLGPAFVPIAGRWYSAEGEVPYPDRRPQVSSYGGPGGAQEPPVPARPPPAPPRSCGAGPLGDTASGAPRLSGRLGCAALQRQLSRRGGGSALPRAKFVPAPPGSPARAESADTSEP
mmetsp:Transcript_70355/g.228708  ORF Transcript_70355/g.228708 Transcript_70355/m.228708 type:complete len:434 (-) Transcript_70355:21-1322(-)